MKTMVSICCVTYNQENYIKDALESFLMQKTDFKFEILIHDDASTDRTAEIIKEYVEKYEDIIKPVYQTENQYSKGTKINDTYNKPRAKGKYIALCEGDDYWIDENKLQEQVDYMEQHPECSLCTHAAKKVSKDKKSLGAIRINKGNKVYTTDDVIVGGGGMFATNSMFYPTILVQNMPKFYIDCSVGDYPLAMYLSLKGNVFYIDKFMSAYRVMSKNSWSCRMLENPQMNTDHINSIEKMLIEVDEYSNYFHTNAIKKAIKMTIIENKFYIMLQKWEFEEVKGGEYRELYSALDIKTKMKIFVKQHCPNIAKNLLNLKRK